MNAIEWQALLVLNGMGAVHEAAGRIAAPSVVAIPPPPKVSMRNVGNRGRYAQPSAEVVAARKERKRAKDRQRSAERRTKGAA